MAPLRLLHLLCCSFKISQPGRYNSFRVCYSFHSSYEEIRDLVMFLKPRRIFPNVVPGDSLQCKEQVCV